MSLVHFNASLARMVLVAEGFWTTTIAADYRRAVEKVHRHCAMTGKSMTRLSYIIAPMAQSQDVAATR